MSGQRLACAQCQERSLQGRDRQEQQRAVSHCSAAPRGPLVPALKAPPGAVVNWAGRAACLLGTASPRQSWQAVNRTSGRAQPGRAAVCARLQTYHCSHSKERLLHPKTSLVGLHDPSLPFSPDPLMTRSAFGISHLSLY